ncbi:MAG: hypothetical protein JWM80_3028 [Cyanobacteria bacterium RYN_339]|nr:hypothetical protein [Cyanobacteria bacterium RYN_339]
MIQGPGNANPTSNVAPKPTVAPPAAAPTAPAAPTGPAPAAGDKNEVKPAGWDHVGMIRPKEDEWPSYQTLFGNAPFVKDAGDLKLKDFLHTAVGVAPALNVPPLSTALKAGKLDPEAVKALQKHLKAQGYDLGPGGADGKLGPKTYAALVQFLDNDGGPKHGMGVDIPAKPKHTVDGHGMGVDIPPQPKHTVDGHGMGVDIPPQPKHTVDGHGLGVDLPPKPLKVDGHGTGVEL